MTQHLFGATKRTCSLPHPAAPTRASNSLTYPWTVQGTQGEEAHAAQTSSKELVDEAQTTLRRGQPSCVSTHAERHSFESKKRESPKCF